MSLNATLAANRRARNFLRCFSMLRKNYSHAEKEKTNIPKLAKLSDKKIMRIKGRDSSKFLQGLVTNDVTKLSSNDCKVMFTMILNSQGRVVYDSLLYSVPGEDNEFFLETDCEAIDGVMKHLKTYKLRAKVEFTDASGDFDVWTLFSDSDSVSLEIAKNEKVLAQNDPRLAELGLRIIVPWNQSPNDLLEIGDHIPVSSAVYKEHRYKIGVAEGINEIPHGNALPLEYNLAWLNGVSFSKGCYIGQELTARTHHVGQIRKRIMPVQLQSDGELKEFPELAPQTSMKTDSGKSAGRLCVMAGKYGLGLLRLKEVAESAYLVLPDVQGNEVKLTASIPCWWPKNN